MYSFAFWQASEGAASAIRRSYSRVAELCRQLIIPVSFSEDARRREYVLNIILVLSMMLLGVFELIILVNHFIIHPHDYVGLEPETVLIFLASTAALYAGSKLGRATLASYLLTGAFTAGTFYAGWTWGVSLPATLLLTALVIVTASILVGSRFGFFMAMVMIAAMAVFGVREAAVLNIPDWRYEEVTATDVVAYATIFLFISFITWLSNKEIKKSLKRARRSEELLSIERDKLEARVAERTRELMASEEGRMRELGHIVEFGKLSQGLFHDLMNPLAAISLSLEHMRQQSARTEDLRDLDSAVNRAVEASSRMRSHMRSVRRCLGTEHIGPSDADDGATIVDNCGETLSSLISEIEIVKDLLAYKARMAGVRIEVSPLPDIHLRIHPMRLHQLLLNLVANGIDACEESGNNSHEVRVEVHTNRQEIIIKVSDTGVGMSSELKHAAIVGRAYSTKIGGTGLGLKTIKSITERYLQGHMEISDADYGGTVFAIHIPKEIAYIDQHRNAEHIGSDKTQSSGACKDMRSSL